MINLDGKKPIYEQIKEQIIEWIHLSILKENDKLPSVRSLAIELGINPNTVAKSYAELEEEGYIYSLNKKGVYVKKQSRKNNLNESFKEKFNLLLHQYLQFGLSKETIGKIIEEELAHD